MPEMEIQNQNNNPHEEDEDAAAAAASVNEDPPATTACLIDTVTIIPPDEQRCRRNSGHSGWRCKNLSAVNNLQYCQQHYDARKNNPPPKKKKKKLDPSDAAPISTPIKLKIKIRRRRDDDGLDASGVCIDGTGSGGGEVGGNESTNHCCLEKRSRRKTKKLDCPCCVNSTTKHHLWEELGICVDLTTSTKITPEINADTAIAIANDPGHKNEGRNLEKVVVPPDELRCRRNDGVNWRCKNYWSSANDLKYCDKHYATRVIGLRRKSTPRKCKPSSVEWGSGTKSIGNDLDSKVELDSEGKIDGNLIDSKVELDSEGKIDGNLIDSKVELDSEGKIDGNIIDSKVELDSEGKIDENCDHVKVELDSGEKSDENNGIQEEKVVESVEEKGNVDAEGGGDLGNVGGFEESNGIVQKEEENVVQEIKKKKNKKKLKKGNRDEGGSGAGKFESEIKDKNNNKKKNKKKKRKREIDSIFGVLNSVKPRKVAEGDQSVDEMPIQGDQSVNEMEIQEATNDTYDSDGILEAFANIGKKKIKVETTKKVELKKCSEELTSSTKSRELKSSTKSRERLVELEKSLQHYKSKWLEMSVELEMKKMECVEMQGKLGGVESIKVVADDEFKKYKRARRKTDERAQEKIIYLEGKIEMIEKDLEHVKRRADDETEYWKKKFCDLETRVLKMEDGNSTLRCVETHKSEKIESKVRGVQNEVTNNNENQSDKSKTSKPDAETSGGKLQTKNNMLNGNGIDINKHPEAESSLPEHSALDISSIRGHISRGGEKVEEGKGGRWEERTSHHGSSSQNHLEMSKKRSVNGVSDSDGENVGQSLEDSDTCSSDSKISHVDVMDKLAMKYKNRNIDKGIKWEIETDMISSFEKDPELCMRAVCALFRQQRSEEKITADWLFHYSDALRGTTLGEFLMDGDRRGDLKKSVEELDKFDAEGREDCKRLAKSYSKQLFRIYQNKEDPFFHPSSTTIP